MVRSAQVARCGWVKANRGFSLTELVMVIGMLAVALALAFASYTAYAVGAQFVRPVIGVAVPVVAVSATAADDPLGPVCRTRHAEDGAKR